MRPYLLDFLIEAHQAFGLLQETLFLTINLLDRYCSKRIVYKKHYQLVGCAALLIASKYGDRKDRVPTIKELKNMCCSLYEDDMFLQMEWHVLQTLNWVIGHPTIDSFLQIAVERLEYDPEVEHMASYIAEIALFQKEFVGTRPSEMARSSLALARCILGRPQDRANEWAGQFNSEILMSLAHRLNQPSLILSRKYSSAHHCRVAMTLDDFLIKQEESKQIEEAGSAPASMEFAEPKQHVTPSKQQAATTWNNGCPTPPDTPINEHAPPRDPPPLVPHNRPLTPPIYGIQPHAHCNSLTSNSNQIAAMG